MELPQDKATTIINPTIVKIIVVGVLVIILIAVFFTVTKGNNICFFSQCNSDTVINPPDAIGLGDLAAA